MFHHNRVRLVLLLAGLAVICHQSAVIDAFSTRTLDHHRLSYLNPQQHASCRSSSSLAAPQNNSNKFLLHGFLDGIFGGGGGESEKDELNAILATYDIKDVSSKDVDTRFESLSDYITNRWIDLFVSGNIKLTTPVKVSKTSESDNDNDNDDSTTTTAVSAKEETVDEVRGCRLVFQKVDTGYKSKGEEKAKGGGGGDDKKIFIIETTTGSSKTGRRRDTGAKNVGRRESITAGHGEEMRDRRGYNDKGNERRHYCDRATEGNRCLEERNGLRDRQIDRQTDRNRQRQELNFTATS